MPLLTKPKLSSYLFEDATACLGLRKCDVDKEIDGLGWSDDVIWNNNGKKWMIEYESFLKIILTDKI